MNSAYSNNIEYARSLQEKYEYYVAGLTFTLLALSVQTASFSSDKIQIVIELLGWISLSVSGLIAINRFRWQPVAHKNFAELDKKRDVIDKFKDAKAKGTREVMYSDTGETVDIDQAITDGEATIVRNEPKINELENKLIAQHGWHLRFFIAGILFIMISRAYAPIQTLVS